MANEVYQSQYTGAQIDALLGGALQKSELTQAEYDHLVNTDAVVNGRWYLIYGDSRKQYLMKVYVGRTLFAVRATSGASGFPYTFPIIFG